MKKNIKLIPIIIAVFAIVFALYYFLGCPIRFLTGLPCPGCGMRHALYYLIMGNVNESLLWHPLLFTMPAAAAIIILHKHFSKKSLIAFLVFYVALFIIVYILRFLNPDDMIVKFDFTQTIWAKWQKLLV